MANQKVSQNGLETPSLPLAGGTLTGPLTLNADPTDNMHPVTKQYFEANNGAGNVGTVTVHKNGTNQSLTAGGFAKLTFSTAVGGGAAWFDDANDRVVAPGDGTYLVHGKIVFTGGIAASDAMLARIYKNGVGGVQATRFAHSTTDIDLTVFDVLDLVSGDYIELFGYKGGSNTTIYGPAISTHLIVTRLK